MMACGPPVEDTVRGVGIDARARRSRRAVARVILHNVQIAVHEWSTAAFAPYELTDRQRQELDQLPPR